MSTDLIVRDGAAVDGDPGTARMDAGGMTEVGVDPGEYVTVAGDDETTLRLGDPVDGEVGIYLDETARTNAGTEVGSAVSVSPASPPPAESLTLAPTRRIRFEGDSLPVATPLEGRVLGEGETVPLSLFGVTVTFVVADLVPEGPAVVTDETAITARESPIEDDDGDLGSEASTATFRDVGGLSEEYDRLRQLVEAPLVNPDLFEELGARPATGVLVHGPTGTGKSLLVHALGNESEANFLPVRPGSGGYDDLDALLVEARSEAPTIVFLDDLDAVAPPRAEATSSERETVGELFAFLDAAAEEDDVAVVAATNRVEEVDEALRRGGRFEHEIEVGVPDPAERTEILAVLTRGLRLDAGVDLGAVADRTHGYVGADLAALVGEAVRHAVERLPEPVQFGEEPPGDVAVTAADFEAAVEAVTPTGVRAVAVEAPDATYRDIGGLEDAKREVARAVEWPLRFPELFERLSSSPPTGVLLYGPPGTGKTMLAKAVANSTDANFLSVNGPELLNKYVGESERGVREVFERARRSAPAVVFFDEVDALAPERGGDGDTGAVGRVVSQLLTEIDGIESGTDVVVIAATNRPDMVDRALLRPGRIEKVVRVPMPDREAREAIFRTHLRGVPVDSVDPAGLAAETEGYTGSDVEAVVREANMLAMEEYLRSHSTDGEHPDPSTLRVTPSHFRQALDRVDPSVTDEMHERYAQVAEEFGR